MQFHEKKKNETLLVFSQHTASTSPQYCVAFIKNNNNNNNSIVLYSGSTYRKYRCIWYTR